MIQTKHNQTGFALLMTLLVVAVVVSITLAVIELSIKQLSLSVTAKDSEIAFHAANAGMECIRYARRAASSSLETGVNSVGFDCFEQNQDLNRQAHSLIENGGDGEIYRYRGEVTWGTGDRCSVIDMVVMVVPDTEVADMEIPDLFEVFTGYPQTETKTCSPGARCTVAEVIGFNRSCADKTLPGTVRREILLEF
jgi:Tfp pilus assembly protein PilV